MVAYDYVSQRWVEGETAISVRRQQLLTELEVLESPRAAEYLRFIGSTCTPAEALRVARAQLVSLQ